MSSQSTQDTQQSEDTNVEQPTQFTVTFSASQLVPNNTSEHPSSDSIESYTVSAIDDKIPPDYTHALQYRSTGKDEAELSPANQPPPPSYNSVIN